MNKDKLKTIAELFLTFFKIGLFTFGGGYAMIPIIEHNCIEKKGWITHREMSDLVVIAESTPGPVAINCATFVGCKRGGVIGSLAATFGVVLPSFIIIYLISLFLDNLLEIKWVASAFKGISCAVGILIVDAALRLVKRMKKDVTTIIIFAVSFVVMMAVNLLGLRFSTVTLMLICGAAGLIVYIVKSRAAAKGGEGKE